MRRPLPSLIGSLAYCGGFGAIVTLAVVVCAIQGSPA
jgi:hypothetical protein